MTAVTFHRENKMGIYIKSLCWSWCSLCTVQTALRIDRPSVYDSGMFALWLKGKREEKRGGAAEGAFHQSEAWGLTGVLTPPLEPHARTWCGNPHSPAVIHMMYVTGLAPYQWCCLCGCPDTTALGRVINITGQQRRAKLEQEGLFLCQKIK